METKFGRALTEETQNSIELFSGNVPVKEYLGCCQYLIMIKHSQLHVVVLKRCLISVSCIILDAIQSRCRSPVIGFAENHGVLFEVSQLRVLK